MSENNEFTFENPQYRKTYWHTCSHVLAQAMKRLYPEEHRGQFEGIRIMFFVFFPMIAGPLLADPICRAFGEKVYQVVIDGNLKFVTGPEAQSLGYDITQIAEGYLPVNELFIAAAIVTLLSLIPMCFASKLYKQRNG